MPNLKFVTTINCVDGNVQTALVDYTKQKFNADYVDSITVPGPNKHIDLTNKTLISAIKARVSLSANAQHSQVLAIVGHHNCAANSKTKANHVKNLKALVKEADTWGLKMKILPFFVNKKGEVEKV